MTPEELDGIPPARLPFDITRALAEPIETRAVEGSAMPTMTGHFSTFNDWYEVNSHIEGHFLERVAPTAFTKTIAESRSKMKVLYDHGQDPSIGNKILGPIGDLTVDETGPRYTVPLLDTSYNRDLAPGLEAGLYGSSFRFSVEKDVWDYSPTRSAYNPDSIPERTITEARVPEFGPVTFPANDRADASARSTTDTFYQRSRDPEGFEALLRSAQAVRTPQGAAEPEPPAVTPEPEPTRADTPPSDPPIERQEFTVPEYTSRDEKAARLSELKDVIKRTATEHTGVMPADVQSHWEADNAEHDALARDIAAYDARMDRLKAIEGDVTTRDNRTELAAPTFIRKPENIYDLERIGIEARTSDEYRNTIRDYSLRSIDGQKMPRGLSLDFLVDVIENGDEGVTEDGQRASGEIAKRVLATGSPAYRRAFNKYLRNQTALWSAEEARAAALAVTATTTTGGYAVPYVFDPTLLQTGVWTAQNPFRAACRTVTITNGNKWLQPTVGAITAAYGTEASAATEGGPTFGQPSFQVQTAKAFATLSVETLEDRPDITAELSSLFAQAKDTLEENEFAVGAGTTVHPMGMFTSTAYTATTTATNDVTALIDFTTTEGALPLRFRAKANWFMNRSTIRQLQILDTTYRYFSGAGIQYPGAINGTLNPNTPPTAASNTGLFLLGYPIWEVPSAVSTLTTNAAILAVLCDPSSYVIVDRLGMNVEVIQQMLNGATPSFPTLQRGVVCWWRNFAAPINADAGRQVTVQ
jgi:HK97 family phage major capsid protein/HK97 family phage prohead protease